MTCVQVAGLPHIEARFGTADGAVHTALLMLDSGAGGTDVMFHARATRELGLQQGATQV